MQPTVQMPPYAWPMYMRPPRNPKQNAAIAAGVLILISGLFALIFGNFILYFGLRVMAGDVTGLDESALVSGVAFLAGFVLSLVSTYLCFRQQRFLFSLVGPVALLVAYFSLIMYEPYILIVAAVILVLCIIALALLLFSLPIFSRGGGWEPQAGAEGQVPAQPPWPGAGGWP